VPQNDFCGLSGQRSLKPINPGMSRENRYESDPYPRACLSCCVMCCCGLQVCDFLIVKFFHFYLLLLNKHFFLFLINFFSISHVKCASPCLDITNFWKAGSIFYCSYIPPFLHSTEIQNFCVNRLLNFSTSGLFTITTMVKPRCHV
jgi:hypothetical protein